MYVLGIYWGHNSTVILMKGGEVVAAVSEERFTRVKNFTGFPKYAIEYVLKEAGVSIKDVDKITLSHKYSVPITLSKFINKKLSPITLLAFLSYLVQFIRNVWGFPEYYISQLRPIGRFFSIIAAHMVGSYSNEKERIYLARRLGVDKEKIVYVDHHLSHAASGYYASPYNTREALVLTLDGEGDMLSGSVNIFNKEHFTTIARIPRDNSLGYLYEHVTAFLGMKPNEHEYKVMGLAAYAKQEHIKQLYEQIKDMVWVDPETLVIHTLYNTTGFNRFLQHEMTGVRFDLLAAVFQKLLEDKITAWVKQCVKKTKINSVVLAGGVFMNVKVNQKVAELDEVKRLFVIPSAADESSILGSSYLAYIGMCEAQNVSLSIPSVKNIYWGPSYTNKEIAEVLKKHKVRGKVVVKKIDNIEKEIAKLLAMGEIVARIAGRMEFGARALGNRSILADPRDYSVVRKINEQIKNRDFWMPFAPSILSERGQDYIENPKEFCAYYMMMSFNSKERARDELKAAMHPYDFTVRPQLVTRELNDKYYKILKEFEKLTGVGGVLNTSFNLHGYPIVLGPKEALDVFAHSGLTHLVLENFLVTKIN